MVTINCYTTREVAEMLGISIRSVQEYIQAKILNVRPRTGKRWLIEETEVLKILRKGLDTKGLKTKLKAVSKKKLNKSLRDIPLIYSTQIVRPGIDKIFQKVSDKVEGPKAIFHGRSFSAQELALIIWMQKNYTDGSESYITYGELAVKVGVSIDTARFIKDYLHNKGFLQRKTNVLSKVIDLSTFFTCESREMINLTTGYTETLGLK